MAASPWLRVYPAPATVFKLSEVAASVLTALDDTGVYTVLDGEDPEEGHPQVLLTRRSTGPQGSGLAAGGRQVSGVQTGGYLFAGTLDLGFTGTYNLGPNAHRYPRDEVSRVVEEHPAVRHATVCSCPAGGSTTRGWCSSRSWTTRGARTAASRSPSASTS